MCRGSRGQAEDFACLRPNMADLLSVEGVAIVTINKDGMKYLETHFSPLIQTMRCTVQRSREILGGKIWKNLGYDAIQR